jgi:hypothetical protein
VAGIALIVPALVAAVSPGAASASTSSASAVAGTARVAAHPGPIPAVMQLREARAEAVATGRPVVIPGMTTASLLTTANPNGSLTRVQALGPVRALRGGKWENLNPALAFGPKGMAVPAVTWAGLKLSGGGPGPLALMTSYGHRLAVSLPGVRLPAPALAGATATYRNVLPGVDLQLTASGLGGVSTVLAVKNAAAAHDRRLASLLRLSVSAPGLRVSASAAGSLSVAAAGAASPLFSAPAPRMWDSAGRPAGTVTVPGPGGVAVAKGSGRPVASTGLAPGAFAHVSAVPLTVARGVVSMTPPTAALTGPQVAYPVFIDPSIYPNPIDGDASNWTYVSSKAPTTSYWMTTDDLPIG